MQFASIMTTIVAPPTCHAVKAKEIVIMTAIASEGWFAVITTARAVSHHDRTGILQMIAASSLKMVTHAFISRLLIMLSI